MWSDPLALLPNHSIVHSRRRTADGVCDEKEFYNTSRSHNTIHATGKARATASCDEKEAIRTGNFRSLLFWILPPLPRSWLFFEYFAARELPQRGRSLGFAARGLPLFSLRIPRGYSHLQSKQSIHSLGSLKQSDAV